MGKMFVGKKLVLLNTLPFYQKFNKKELKIIEIDVVSEHKNVPGEFTGKLFKTW